VVCRWTEKSRKLEGGLPVHGAGSVVSQLVTVLAAKGWDLTSCSGPVGAVWAGGLKTEGRTDGRSGVVAPQPVVQGGRAGDQRETGPDAGLWGTSGRRGGRPRRALWTSWSGR
jgi:hypothetical protein